MFIIGAVGSLLTLAAMVIVTAGSLVCYIKTSRLSAAVMFVSSVVMSVSIVVRDAYPWMFRNQSLCPCKFCLH